MTAAPSTAVFYHDAQQQRLAEQSKAAIERRLGRSVATEIRPAAEFYAAEDYHPDYYCKNPWRYKLFRHRCGRDQRLEALWGKPLGAAAERRTARVHRNKTRSKGHSIAWRRYRVFARILSIDSCRFLR